MQVMIGQSGEVAPGQWRKCDITLDHTDFLKLLAEFERVGAQYTTTQMFTILELECQRLIHAEFIIRAHKSTDRETIDGWKVALKEFTVSRNDAIQKLKPGGG